MTNVGIRLLSQMPPRLMRPLEADTVFDARKQFERSSPTPGDSSRKRKREDADTQPRKAQKTDNQVSIYLFLF
jgi:hypothetical protein